MTVLTAPQPLSVVAVALDVRVVVPPPELLVSVGSLVLDDLGRVDVLGLPALVPELLPLLVLLVVVVLVVLVLVV